MNFIPSPIKHPTGKAIHKHSMLGEFNFFLGFEARCCFHTVRGISYTESRLVNVSEITRLYTSVRMGTCVAVGQGVGRGNGAQGAQ